MNDTLEMSISVNIVTYRVDYYRTMVNALYPEWPKNCNEKKKSFSIYTISAYKYLDIVCVYFHSTHTRTQSLFQKNHFPIYFFLYFYLFPIIESFSLFSSFEVFFPLIRDDWWWWWWWWCTKTATSSIVPKKHLHCISTQW